MAKITLRINESGTITLVLKDTAPDGTRVVRVETASDRADLSRAADALLNPVSP